MFSPTTATPKCCDRHALEGLFYIQKVFPVDITFVDFPSYHPLHKIASSAFAWFSQPSGFEKIYLDPLGKNAYGKTLLALINPYKRELPHSIRKLNSSSFILTLHRKSPATLIGKGVHKIVKKAWLLTFTIESGLTCEAIACAKAVQTAENRFFINYLELLPKQCEGVESQSIHFHQTADKTYKKFHAAPLALCDGSKLNSLSIKPNFSDLISIFLNLARGALNLMNADLIHGDLKPENVVIYFYDGKYSAKFCDLSSLERSNDSLREQTFNFLSPLHRYALFQKVLESHPDASIEQIIKEYPKHIKSKVLKLTPESMLQSLGLVFSSMALKLTTSKGTVEQMDLFWRTIFDLTGFRPESEGITMQDFQEKIDTKLLESAKRNTPPPGPTVNIDQVIERLTILSLRKHPAWIPIEETYETTVDFSIVIEGGKNDTFLSDFRFFLGQILKISRYATGFKRKKIYFNDSSAYTKESTQLISPQFPHSLRALRSDEGNRWIVVLNRKSPSTLEMKDNSIKKKYGWEIISKDPNQFLTRQVLICTDTLSRTTTVSNSAMEGLRDLTCVECTGERPSFQTNHNLFKQLHISSAEGVNGGYFARTPDETTFPQFLEICAQILTGISELHENGLVYGNLKPNKILIFKNKKTGECSAKISSYFGCSPIGSVCTTGTIDYFSPRIKRLIKEQVATRIADPTNEEMHSEYNKSPIDFNIILTHEDETVTAGIVLAHLAMSKTRIMSSATSEQQGYFWHIISSLTGGFIQEESFKRGITFLQDRMSQIDDAPDSAPPTSPTMTLRAAAARLQSLSS